MRVCEKIQGKPRRVMSLDVEGHFKVGSSGLLQRLNYEGMFIPGRVAPVARSLAASLGE